MQKKEYRIDGRAFSDLQGFYDEISQKLIPGATWGKNLDAFSDILSGGFGTPEEGFVLVWESSQISRANLGYKETIKELEKRLLSCHPLNRESVSADLDRAKRNEGQTVFDWLVEIILVHCPGGNEEADAVELVFR